MNRLLEGDVGSGKTIVAAIAAYVTYLNHKKTVLMAPTQILASQHFQTFSKLLSPEGISIQLVTSASKSNLLGDKSKTSNSDILIGTHALLHKKNLEENKDIALIVIDEQHRFGVSQRSHFQANKSSIPHILTMTATPIPRTVALTIYGDLELSVINTMPKDREIITTWIVPPEKRKGAYQWMHQSLKTNKSQAFIICPFIETSESNTSIKAATVEYQRLKTGVFPGLKLALLHGKMKADEKDKIMNDFREGKFDILVSTPVVEVGIDNPNATIILIEDAQRFGLAQLHQLRGRVGRGHKKSYCLLFSTSDESSRLQALEKTHSGLELAELDLKLRGPGDIFGTSQHGFVELKVASFTDANLIQSTKTWAQKVFPDLKNHPSLHKIIENGKIPKVEPN